MLIGKGKLQSSQPATTIMEKKKFTIEEQIQLTLGCIDKIERVAINPWLPTRLKEKLKKKATENYRIGILAGAFLFG